MVHISVYIYRGERKLRLEILFFLFFFLPALSCLNLPASQYITKPFLHMGPNFLPDTLIKPSLKVKQNFTCYSREDFFGINLQRRGAYLSHQGISGL